MSGIFIVSLPGLHTILTGRKLPSDKYQEIQAIDLCRALLKTTQTSFGVCASLSSSMNADRGDNPMSILKLSKLRIVPFDSIHLHRASQFLYSNWQLTYADKLPADIVEQRSMEYFIEYLSRKAGICWLGLYGEKMVGLISVSSNNIEELWVDSQYRRRKIASQLQLVALRHFEIKAFQFAQMGCENFNHELHAFLGSCGWKKIACEPVNIIPGKRVLAWVYSTEIIPSISRYKTNSFIGASCESTF